MKTWSTNISATDLDRRWSRRKTPLLNIDVVEKRNKRMATTNCCLKGYETNTARFKSPFGCQMFQTMCLNEERLACRSVLWRLLFAMASSCDGFFLRWLLLAMITYKHEKQQDFCDVLLASMAIVSHFGCVAARVGSLRRPRLCAPRVGRRVLPGGLRFAAFACNANMLIRKCCLHELSLEFE